MNRYQLASLVYDLPFTSVPGMRPPERLRELVKWIKDHSPVGDSVSLALPQGLMSTSYNENELYNQMMQLPIRKATFIVRLWTDGDPRDDNAWRGSAEHIGGQSGQFQTLDELIDWLRHELGKTSL
jgi:hypothetical protein